MKIGEITYDELPKELIFTVVKDEDKDRPKKQTYKIYADAPISFEMKK